MSADRLERNAHVVTVLTFASRLTGLVRDAVLSRCFGVGPVMDAFALAFMLPNLFRRLFGEGALSAAFLPVYARLDRDDLDAAKRLAALLVAGLFVVLGGLTLIGEGVLWWLSTRTTAPSGHDLLALRLMMITLPYMPLVCLVAIFGAMLQVHGRFGPTAASPIILNVCIVFAALGSAHLAPSVLDAVRVGDTGEDPSGRARIVIVCLAVIVAGLLQVAWALWSLRTLRVPWLRPTFAQGSALREVLVKAGPMILGLGVLQVNTFVDGIVASWPTLVGPTIFGVNYPLESGALATLGYAQRLYEFPLGVFGIAVATAIFPLLSKQARNPAAFADTLRRGLRLVVYIGLPASVGLMLVSTPLTGVVLQGGDFGPGDTARVAFVLVGYAPAVWAYSMNHTLTRGLYALGDTMTPVRISVWMVFLNFTINIALIWTPLREAGLAWSTAVCAVLQSALLARSLRRRIGPFVDDEVRRSWGRTSIATVAMAAATWPLAWVLAPHDASWRQLAYALAACVIAGAAVFVIASKVLRMPELAWALGRRGRP